MKIVFASDSYKGCLSSREVAEAARQAFVGDCPSRGEACLTDCDFVALALADGGEGTVDALTQSMGGDFATALVSDPLGRTVCAVYGIAGDTAIIESAAACGLTLLRAEERNPLKTTSRGLGELISDAIAKGCRNFIIGLGGTATNDGGAGMLSVPGLLEKAKRLKFTVACDVDATFVGPRGASRVFAPQKGADREQVEVLERSLEEFAEAIEKQTGVNVRNMPGAGAAGGLGGAFKAYFNAELKRGADMVLDALGFDEIIEGAGLVITGEGCSDSQTITGKAPFGVLQRASVRGVPVALLSGAVNDEELLRAAGFSFIERVSPPEMPLKTAMEPETAKSNIRAAMHRLLKQRMMQGSGE